MMSPVGPARRSPRIRRTLTSAAEILDAREGTAAAAANLPVPVGPARTLPPKTPVASAAQIEAQLMGERRGLRAGASTIDGANVTYSRTQWSGAEDRRAPKGRAAKTET